MLSVLLKKQFIEALSVFKKDKKHLNVFGACLTFVLIAAIVSIGVFVFSRFINLYCNIKFNGISDIPERQFELLTIIYFFVLIVGLIGSIRTLSFSIFESDDKIVLSTLPVKSSAVFYSKLIILYLKQLAIYFIILLPLNLTFATVTAQSTYYVIASVALCFVFPIITFAVASIFCLPAYLIKRALKSKYALSLLIVTGVTAVLFWCYSALLDFFNDIITTGEIRFFFKEETMLKIISVSQKLFPTNIIARILLKTDLLKNIGVLAATTAIVGALGFGITSLLYYKAQFKSSPAERAKKGRQHKHKSAFVALLQKEYNLIFKTPSYAFQYFSVAAVMPLMVYFCMGIGTDLLQTVLFAQNNFELAILVTLLFGTLTNTFCATSISRDGEAFFTLKTLPLAPQMILGAKIVASSIVALVSNIICCIMLAALGYITVGEAVFILVIASVVSEAQICIATRMDLNHPSFPQNDGEAGDNSSVSAIICIGLGADIVIGGFSLFISIYYGSILNFANFRWRVILFVSLSAAVFLASAIAFIYVGLKKRYSRIAEGE